MQSRKTTVIVNNRDLLAWPRAMVEHLKYMDGVNEIIILDNGSTNRSLLQWYKETDVQVIFIENLGHTAPWRSGLVDNLKTDYYVVTDPDLDLTKTPKNALAHLQNILDSNSDLEKVGLYLDTHDIPENSPYYEHVKRYEAEQQARASEKNLFIRAPVDTTFALYDRRRNRTYGIGGARTLPPYSAKHLPWYVLQPEGDFEYYLNNASRSSSYTWFSKHAPKGEIEKLYAIRTAGKLSTKWSSYLPIYDNLLSPLKYEQIRMLEIGVQNGGSLDVWSQYFTNAICIVGCDGNARISSLKYEDARVKTVVGIASDLAVVQSVVSIAQGPLDLVIDDGSHDSIDTIKNFLAFFPVLTEGGTYIVEDMHCAYWQEYNGGFFNQRSAAWFFKALVDLVNVEHSRGDFDARRLFQSFFGANPVPPCLTDGSVYSVSFYNSIFVVKKSRRGNKPILGDVVRSGDQAIVEPRAAK